MNAIEAKKETILCCVRNIKNNINKAIDAGLCDIVAGFHSSIAEEVVKYFEELGYTINELGHIVKNPINNSRMFKISW
jgi:hypothetical protein